MLFKKTPPPAVLTKEEALAFLEMQDLTIEDISSLAIKTLGPLFTNEILTKQDEYDIFDKIAEIPGSEDYFRDTMSRDLKRFFASQSDAAREQVRGAYSRPLYMRSLLNRKEDGSVQKPVQMGGDRYHTGSD